MWWLQHSACINAGKLRSDLIIPKSGIFDLFIPEIGKDKLRSANSGKLWVLGLGRQGPGLKKPATGPETVTRLPPWFCSLSKTTATGPETATDIPAALLS